MVLISWPYNGRKKDFIINENILIKIVPVHVKVQICHQWIFCLWMTLVSQVQDYQSPGWIKSIFLMCDIPRNIFSSTHQPGWHSLFPFSLSFQQLYSPLSSSGVVLVFVFVFDCLSTIPAHLCLHLMLAPLQVSCTPLCCLLHLSNLEESIFEEEKNCKLI